MSRYHLAQLNIARLREPLESPGMADFVANLERINALAEASPGYLWRLQDEAGDATAIRPFGAEVLVNLSLWRDVQSLSDYVYKSAHAEMLKRRREWFDKAEQAHMCCGGCRPAIVLAWKRRPSVWRTCASMVPVPMPSAFARLLRRRMRLSLKADEQTAEFAAGYSACFPQR